VGGKEAPDRHAPSHGHPKASSGLYHEICGGHSPIHHERIGATGVQSSQDDGAPRGRPAGYEPDEKHLFARVVDGLDDVHLAPLHCFKVGAVPSLGRPRNGEEGLQSPGRGKPGQECDGVKQRGEVPVRSSPSSPPGAIAGLDGLQELSGNGFVSHLSSREQGEDRMACGAQPHVSPHRHAHRGVREALRLDHLAQSRTPGAYRARTSAEPRPEGAH